MLRKIRNAATWFLDHPVSITLLGYAGLFGLLLYVWMAAERAK